MDISRFMALNKCSYYYYYYYNHASYYMHIDVKFVIYFEINWLDYVYLDYAAMVAYDVFCVTTKINMFKQKQYTEFGNIPQMLTYGLPCRLFVLS